MNMPKRIGALLAIAVLSWTSAMTRAEDIDLFAAGSGAVGAAPNLVIILDNTAHWSRPLGAMPRLEVVKGALAAAVDALSDATGHLNVGLILFNEAGAQSTGGPGGAYVRFAVRTMSEGGNRAQLVATIAGLDVAVDQAREGQPAMALEEARRVLGGMPVLNGNGTGAKVDRRALDASGRGYLSPNAAGDCRRNIVIFVGNGPPSASDALAALPFVSALNGGIAPAPLPLPAPYPSPSLPASQDAAVNWMDEYAALLRRVPYGDGAPGSVPDSILTYAIALHDPGDPADNMPGAASGRALIMNAAIQGGGRYFDVTDTASLRQAFGAIFSDILAVDSSFASPALPVSVNPLGTHLNQVYMGMFRPAAAAGPRWPGNLKQYQFAYNSSTGVLELVDALNQPAINATGGYVAPVARSFWSTATTTGPVLPAGSATVDFFANAPAGTGLTPAQQRQEAPDGEVVDKGGAAQQLRAAYLGDQSARNVYTCPAAECDMGAPLAGSAAHAFDASNLDCATYGSAFRLDAGVCATELPRLIEWIRGADNAGPGNEAVHGPAGLGPTPVRASIHGDVLHSRPLLINYGTAGIVAFYGANDGTLRAVQAGQPATGGGRELWAFIAPETYPKFRRLRDASPPLQWPSPSSGLPPVSPSRSAARPRDYFFDGAVTSHEERDAAGNIVRAFLFAAARRGGSFIYAFDVSVPAAPRFLWKHAAQDGTDRAFDDLALTFSGVKAATVAGHPHPVVVFGGGYHGGYEAGGAPLGEDAEPAAPCAATPAQGCGNRIYVLDAATGNVVRTFQANAGRGGDLAHGVAADLALVDAQGAGVIDRAYAADLGGNLWRIDFDRRGTSQWRMRKLASAGNAATPRKFLFAPDVVATRDQAAVLIGSGDREKPLKAGSADRFYMIRDREAGPGAADSAASTGWPIAADTTTGGNMADVLGMPADRLRDTLAATGNNGWFYALPVGEKVVNAPLTAGGIVYFGTHSPAPSPAGRCRADLGTARAYGLFFNAGTAGRDLDGNGTLDPGDAAVTLAGGGLSPSPVAGFVNVLDAATNRSVVVPFVIGAGGTTGGATGLPSQSAPARISLNLSKARKKTYWFFRSSP